MQLLEVGDNVTILTLLLKNCVCIEQLATLTVPWIYGPLSVTLGLVSS